VGILLTCLQDDLSSTDADLSPARVLGLIRGLRERYGLPDTGITEGEVDRESDEWDLDHVFGLLEETAGAMFTQDAAGWFEQGGRDQLIGVLQQSAAIPVDNLRPQDG